MATLSLYVNGLGIESSDWIEVGDSPYLNAQDQPTHYIYSAVKKAEHGDFTFADTAMTGTINSVHLYIYGESTGQQTQDITLWDGTGWSSIFGFVFGSWGWVNVDVSTFLDSWTKINAAKMHIQHENIASNCGIDVAYLYVDYTPTEQDGEDIKSASTRIALINESVKSASTRICYSGEDVKSASTRIKRLNEDVKSASTRIKANSEDVKSASTRVALINESVKSASTRVVIYEIAGVTKDKDGNTKASCKCFLFKDNLDDTLTFIGYTISDGSGNYSFKGIHDNDAQYLVYSFKDDTPHVFDVTDHVLQPTAV